MTLGQNSKTYSNIYNIIVMPYYDTAATPHLYSRLHNGNYFMLYTVFRGALMTKKNKTITHHGVNYGRATWEL